MNNIHFAAIDIGSNAVRLVVKSIERDPLDNSESLGQELLIRFPLRLGKDSFTKGEISKATAKNLQRLMKSFGYMLKIFTITDFRACATSAMRDACNGREIVEKIRKKTGISIEIIDGEEEARMVYETHIEREFGQDSDYMYVDVGGGSTQISFIKSGKLIYSNSFNIGTVRMMNDKVNPEEKEAFLSKLQELHVQYPGFKLVGSGGNINKLQKLLQSRKNSNVLNVKKLEQLYQELTPLAVETRMKKYKIKRDRAEVIGYAAEIFLDAAKVLKINQIIVPSISIADGIINQMYLTYTGKE